MARQTGRRGSFYRGGSRASHANSNGNNGGIDAESTSGGSGRGRGTRLSSTKKAVFKPSVRALPVGVHGLGAGESTHAHTLPVSATSSKGQQHQNQASNATQERIGHPGLLLVNRKPFSGSSKRVDTLKSKGTTAPPLAEESQTAAKTEATKENPWIARGRQLSAQPGERPETSSEATATAAAVVGRGPSKSFSASSTGSRQRQQTMRRSSNSFAQRSLQSPSQLPPMPALVGDGGDGSERWDEMLDNGIDFSEDIEFADGTAVRIKSATPPEVLLPTTTSPPTQQESRDSAAAKASENRAELKPGETLAHKDRGSKASSGGKDSRNGTKQNGVIPGTGSCDQLEQPGSDEDVRRESEAKPVLPTWAKVDRAGGPLPIADSQPAKAPHVAEPWGRPSKPTAPSQPSDDSSKSAAPRWWKASLSGGLRTTEPSSTPLAVEHPRQPLTPALLKPTPPSRRSTDESSRLQQSSKNERGPRLQRGSRRHHQVPIPTVVPPLLLTRAGTRNISHGAPSSARSDATPASAKTSAPEPPSSALADDTALVKEQREAGASAASASDSPKAGVKAAADSLPPAQPVAAAAAATTTASDAQTDSDKAAAKGAVAKLASTFGEPKLEPANSDVSRSAKAAHVPQLAQHHEQQQQEQPSAKEGQDSWSMSGNKKLPEQGPRKWFGVRESRLEGSWRSGSAPKLLDPLPQQLQQAQQQQQQQQPPTKRQPALSNSRRRSSNEAGGLPRLPQQGKQEKGGKLQAVSAAKIAKSWRADPSQKAGSADTATATATPATTLPGITNGDTGTVSLLGSNAAAAAATANSWVAQSNRSSTSCAPEAARRSNLFQAHSAGTASGGESYADGSVSDQQITIKGSSSFADLLQIPGGNVSDAARYTPQPPQSARVHPTKRISREYMPISRHHSMTAIASHSSSTPAVTSRQPSGLTSPPLLPHTMLADILGENEVAEHGSGTPQSSVSVGGGNSGVGRAGNGRVASKSIDGKEGIQASSAGGAIQQTSPAEAGGSSLAFGSQLHSSASLFNLEGSPVFGPYGAAHPGFHSVPPPGHHTPVAPQMWQRQVGAHEANADSGDMARAVVDAVTRSQPTHSVAGMAVGEQSWSYHPAFAPQPGYTVYGGFGENGHAGAGGAGGDSGGAVLSCGPGPQAFGPFSSGAAMLWTEPGQGSHSGARPMRFQSDSRSSSRGETGRTSRGHLSAGRAPRPIGTRSTGGSNSASNPRYRQNNMHGRQHSSHQDQQQQQQQQQLMSQPPSAPASQHWQPHYAAADSRFYSSSHQSPRMVAVPSPGPSSAPPYMMPLDHRNGPNGHHSMATMPPPQHSFEPAAAPASHPVGQYGVDAPDAGGDPSSTGTALPGMMAPQYMPPGSVRPSPPPLYSYGYPPGPMHHQHQQQYLAFPPHHQVGSPHIPPPFAPMYMSPSSTGGGHTPGAGNMPYFYGSMHHPQIPHHPMAYIPTSDQTNGQASDPQQQAFQQQHEQQYVTVSSGPNERPLASQNAAVAEQPKGIDATAASEPGVVSSSVSTAPVEAKDEPKSVASESTHEAGSSKGSAVASIQQQKGNDGATRASSGRDGKQRGGGGGHRDRKSLKKGSDVVGGRPSPSPRPQKQEARQQQQQHLKGTHAQRGGQNSDVDGSDSKGSSISSPQNVLSSSAVAEKPKRNRGGHRNNKGSKRTVAAAAAT
ncbi:hypothetical protein GQ54DRAFT_202316 [Martensiomyces pterosporus]|nr:hypothetical protein GQ54DRAFT_202316 [Martensiomyces pterosporus]